MPQLRITSVLSRFRVAIAAIGLFVLTHLLYAPCANFGFLNYDDERILVHHPELYAPQSLQQTLRSILFTELPREEPLLVRDLSWALDARIFGFDNPGGYHSMNVSLHAGVIVLLFLFALQLSGRYWQALITALLCMTLAIHVEPVAWIMGRKDILSGFFGTLTLMCYVAGVRARLRTRQIAGYAASLLFLVLALYSKINMIVLPGVLFLLTLLQRHLHAPADTQPSPWRVPHMLMAGLALLPHFAISASICIWYNAQLTQFGVLERGYGAEPLEHLWNLLRINPLVLLTYVKQMIVPGDLALFYPWPGLDQPYPWYHGLLALAVVLGLISAALVLIKRHSDLTFYVFSALVLMLPYLNLRFFGIWVAERYVYFISFFLIAGAVSGIQRLIEARSVTWRYAAIAIGGLVLAFNVRAQQLYLPAWQNNETLWTYHIKHPRAVPDAYQNLASHYYTQAIRVRSDAARSEQLLTQTQEIVAEARKRFSTDPRNAPKGIERVLFLDALVAIVRQEDPKHQIELMREVEAINPDFDAVLWQLMSRHYHDALANTDPASREKGARLALAYYGRYRDVTPRERTFAKRDDAILKEFKRDFPFLAPSIDALPGTGFQHVE